MRIIRDSNPTCKLTVEDVRETPLVDVDHGVSSITSSGPCNILSG